MAAPPLADSESASYTLAVEAMSVVVSDGQRADPDSAREIARLSEELAACRVREQEKDAQLRASQAETVRVMYAYVCDVCVCVHSSG